MKYFLSMIIVLMGCGGFYEYNILNSRHEGDEQRVTDATAEVAPLKDQVATLTAANAKLTKQSDDDQTALTDLGKQVQEAQLALMTEKQKESAGKPAPVTDVSNPIPTPGTNNLGTIGTLDGKVYPNCQLMKVQADGIVVSYTGGITQVSFNLMQPELQKRFGFDPKMAFTLTADQVAVLELKRKASGSTAGN